MKKKDIFTTSDVANLCQVSSRLVVKWFEEGHLKGHQLPGSRHRRFRREDLVKFLTEYDMLDFLLESEQELT